MGKRAAIFAGEHNRFLIRPFKGGFAIHDAEAVSDDQVRSGIGSPKVAEAVDIHEARWLCERLGRP